ncbi:MAG: carbamoyl-phosphate synthase large subunit [Micavibrio aeruginosavorus]|uniref:Carbamoyl phosphate synthase large chain n=1 Tax=Micavibrio aeruginosavorus TaxID=349221 RepID=A0A7T5R4H8_9BACT|nr:MAG: carbamoyl-phosphate synthase large subunit [Micavibrio aeruginosavorus]
MPRRTDLKSICIIGAGPIVIGQACEFDYSGTQACKALKEEGYRVVLVNSNPATIMTDPGFADATYVEPITPAVVAKILEKERPDALLPTMGGQTALNAAMALHNDGTLKRLNIELIGARADVIDRAEDRLKFRDCMDTLGLESPKSQVVKTLEEARAALPAIGLPAIIRPSFTLAGTGGGIAYNREEFEYIVKEGLDASPVHEVLVEESVLGWKEYEMEVVRDRKDNCIIICAIENIDPMGVHTGDSITVAPALTLTDKEYQIMRNASLKVLRGIGVETGGSNVQFAINPVDGRMVVIEMNPRVSRSSALASKATGFPIAKIAAKLAVGYTLDELGNDITGGKTPASFEPTIDYVVTKVPRFAFEKFRGTQNILTTSMKSVGEVMAMGRSFEESMQKALRSLEKGLTGFDEIKIGEDDKPPHPDQIRAALARPTPQRILYVAQALRYGFSVEDIHNICKYDRWFIERIKNITDAEARIKAHGLPIDSEGWLKVKKMGFSDARLAKLMNVDEKSVRKARHKHNVRPVYKRVDSCAAEIPSQTSYMYGCYEGDGINPPVNECRPTGRKKVVILGGGPNRIGQGIEFDYCCVHASFALREAGYESIMVNCNPETVSTDYDTSDRLYFEPLTAEDVIELIDGEKKNGDVLGVIVQLGGQTPLKLADALEEAGITILGTSVDAIDLAEDRERFQKLLHKLKLRQPPNGLARSEKEALAKAEDIGFPIVVRPSYVLGGQGMEIVHSKEELQRYINTAVRISGSAPVLLDRYLRSAIEVDVDALCDGNDVYVSGIMEHIEEAGVHSGDSACVLPPHSLPYKTVRELEKQTILLAKSLKVKGLINIQFALKRNKNTGEFDIYILEVNPRASRTVPFVAKATGVPVAKIAARLMVGETLSTFRAADMLTGMPDGHTAVKAPVFPFSRFPGVDPLLGPEMKSTGEVMGIDRDMAQAFAKSQLAAGTQLPLQGTVFLSVKDSDKPEAVTMAQDLIEMGFRIIATGGTCKVLQEKGLPVTRINKVMEGQPHIVDAIINGEISLMINTTTKGPQAFADSDNIRRMALMHKIPHYTLLTAARAGVQSIRALRAKEIDVAPLQDYLPQDPGGGGDTMRDDEEEERLLATA